MILLFEFADLLLFVGFLLDPSKPLRALHPLERHAH